MTPEQPAGPRPLRVYVAGPYSKGVPDETFVRVIDAAERLSDAGYVPFVPHTMTFMWAIRHQRPVDFWYDFDLRWLEVCDAIVRLPGESKGADAEVAHAVALKMPVYLGVDALFAACEAPQVGAS